MLTFFGRESCREEQHQSIVLTIHKFHVHGDIAQTSLIIIEKICAINCDGKTIANRGLG